MGMGSSALEAERPAAALVGLRLSDSSHLRAPNFRESRFFRVAQNMVRQKIQGGGYKKLDAEDLHAKR